ncbi:T9SS type A sorting domain-containing protein [bacterium]|nr:T9SS type A sorting domain-containing protein [bacterium]
MYRVPIACYTQDIVGDHSAETPEFFSHEVFLENMTWRVEQAVENGGMLIVYTHHLGDTDDTYGNVNYGSGGLTVEELGWIIDLVQQYDGAIMTFSDAVDYYRSKSDMTEIDGDYVWVAREQETSVVASSPRSVAVSPNPFNPSTQISWSGFSSGATVVSIYDTKGRLVVQSHDNNGSFSWSGLDMNGRKVSSGTYIAKVSDGIKSETATITLVP